MQWTASNKLALTAFLMVLLMFSCTPKQTSEYTGSHSTQRIRIVWQKCYAIYNLSTKGISPQKAQMVCDCFVDAVRKKYDSKYIEKQATQGYLDREYEDTVNRLGEECSIDPFQSIQFSNYQMRLHDKKFVYSSFNYDSSFNLFHQSKLFNHWQDLQSRGAIGTEVPSKEHLF